MPKHTLRQREDRRYRAWYKGKQFYGQTQREAIRKRDEYKRQIELGLSADSVTVAEYCVKWLSTYKQDVAPRTLQAYTNILRQFCRFGKIGGTDLKQITSSDIKAYFNSLSGKSHSLVSKHALTIRGLFRAAVADRLITYDPTAAIRPPKAERGTHRTITDEERALIQTTPSKLMPISMVMLYAGLRRGEALALDIDRDVDFDAKLIHVRRAMRDVRKREMEEGPPKTAAGVRDVPLVSVLADVLKGHHGRLVPFTGWGAWESAWDTYMRVLSKRAGHPVSFRQHDLRHSYCSMLYDAGVDIKTAQKWMGHASPDVTLRIYTHFSEKRQATSTEALEIEAKKRSAVQFTVQNETANA